MNDAIYVGKSRPKRGCGCMVVAGLLLLALVIGVVVWLRSDRSAEPLPDPPPSPDGTATPSDTGGDESIPLPDRPVGPDLGLEWLSEARQAFADTRIHEARKQGFAILEKSRDPKALDGARDLLGDIHTKMVFNKIPMAEKKEHTVTSGESLGLLAKRYGSTIELVRDSNGLSSSMIRIGDRFLILSSSFSIEVDKSDNLMIVYLNDRFFKWYRVGTGQYSSTPTGTFVVNDRIKHPDWWTGDGKKIPYGDPKNLLGTHWLSLDKPGYGIHGTWDDDTIGHQASAGCVRMLNEEVEELFKLIPLGTQVEVLD